METIQVSRDLIESLINDATLVRNTFLIVTPRFSDDSYGGRAMAAAKRIPILCDEISNLLNNSKPDISGDNERKNQE